jgi:DNA-binding response OmpR family regulator
MTTRASKEKRILVVGQSLSLVEGVADLLQMVGYPVHASAALPEAGFTDLPVPPDLMIVDLSVAASDIYHRSEKIREEPLWSEVPILYVSFSGDDHIRELRRRGVRHDDHRSRFYAPPILGLDGLLETVKTYLD